MSYVGKSANKMVQSAEKERIELESRGFRCRIHHEEMYAHMKFRLFRSVLSRLKSCLTLFRLKFSFARAKT